MNTTIGNETCAFVNPDLWTFSSQTSKHFENSILTIIFKIFRFCPSVLVLFLSVFF